MATTGDKGNGGSGRHVVRSFDQDLQQLNGLIVRMGGLVEHQLASAIRALSNHDDELALSTRERDREVDLLEEEVDQLAVKLLATRQPLAIDLRIIVMALKISNDLERIGDYAKSICKRVLDLSEQRQTFRRFVIIPHMTEILQEMIRDVLDAFVERDPDKAMAIWKRDDEVDELYECLLREVITFILEDPRKTSACIHLLFIAKHLERTGDHITNIAERVNYMVKGEQINWMRNEVE